MTKISPLEQRALWRERFAMGLRPDDPTRAILEQYEKYREMDAWLTNIELEKMCEYALYLEARVSSLESIK